MKKLPKIYQNKINKKIGNNTNYSYAKKEIYNFDDKQNIISIINSLFDEDGFVFNKQLIIKTKYKVYDTAIIKKDNNRIYTLTDDVIKIEDILSIERK